MSNLKMQEDVKWALARNAAVAPQLTECYADAYLAAPVKGREFAVKHESGGETVG
jgi:hypothetical protein